jgi:hypothetical protein
MLLKKYKSLNYKLLSKEQKQELKQIILKNKLHREAGQLSLKSYRLYQMDVNGLYYPSLKNYSYEDLYNDKETFIKRYGSTTLKVANNLNQASYKRVARLKERIREAVESGSAYFITITFNNETLSKTNEKTRRLYITRWLKTLSPFYVANIDYGKTKGREHYHAVITSDQRPPKTWSYGFIDIKKVATSETDTKRVSKYISKLTNHAIKHTTKSKRIIYSRKSK